MTTDDGFLALTTGDEVVALAQRQVDGMRAVDHDHSDVLELEITPVSSASALCSGESPVVVAVGARSDVSEPPTS